MHACRSTLEDPTILRCLQPDPAKRPASAIAVAAALPGGDPLAAALAAGETPSPQMVAAAGEGAGLSMRVALPLYLWVLAGIVATGAFYLRHSGLERIPGKLSTPVLENKAREIARAAGYAETPEDTASGWMWAGNYLSWVQENDKPVDWTRVMQGRPPALRFWYREHIDWMVAEAFHDDLLTPGMMTMDDPSPVMASMVSMQLDPWGRLLEFRAMPPSKLDSKPAGAVDWGPLFRAAEVDAAQMTAAEPERLFLEAGDTRVAWTGKWPGSDRPLRVEGVALGGKPVVFTLLGPWSPVDRAASRPAPTTMYDLPYLVLGVIALVVVIATLLLVPRNLRRGRADVRGAVRLGVFLFCVHMALWVTRTHFTWSAGLLGMFFIAFCTSVFYGALVCGVYLALEPFVRRHWPQTMIGWTRALAGQVRDPRVGRDVLIGASVSILWRASEFVSRAVGGQNWLPDLVSPEQFHTVRAALGEALEGVPHGVRDSLMFLFFIVLMRVVLRNQWLAGGSFVALFTFLAWGKGAGAEAIVETAVVYGTYAFVLLRFGLLAVASMVTFDSIVADMPFTTDVGIWYFPATLLMLGILFAIATWGFREATRGQKLFREEWI